jgi:hypothetical protein
MGCSHTEHCLPVPKLAHVLRVLEGQDAGVEFRAHHLGQRFRHYYRTNSTSTPALPSKRCVYADNKERS